MKKSGAKGYAARQEDRAAGGAEHVASASTANPTHLRELSDLLVKNPAPDASPPSAPGGKYRVATIRQ